MAFNINVSNLDGLLQTRNLKETSGGSISEKLTKAAARQPELAEYLKANVGKPVRITLDGALSFTDEAYGKDVTLVAVATNVKVGQYGLSSMRLPFFVGGLAMMQQTTDEATPNVVKVVVTTGEYEDGRTKEKKTWFSFATVDGNPMTIDELGAILREYNKSKKPATDKTSKGQSENVSID